jgi:hypothetical protein
VSWRPTFNYEKSAAGSCCQVAAWTKDMFLLKISKIAIFQQALNQIKLILLRISAKVKKVLLSA